jgi:ribosomal protein L7/L12
LFGRKERRCEVFAVLEFSDFIWIALIVSLFAAAYSVYKPSDAARLRRLEAKVNLILKHLGLEYKDPATGGLSEEVKTLADDPARKIEAIKLHRKQTRLSLMDAKDAVEGYIAGRG